MHVALLYAAVVLIWGSTWATIPFQLGVVAEEISVAYRFGLGSAALFVFAAASRRRIRIPLHHYGMVIVMGALMFSTSYLFTYWSINYVTSGLVAVVFSLIVVSNAFFERIFFRTRIESRLVYASLLGVFGVALLFWPEVSKTDFQDQSIKGIALVTVAVIFASLGNMAAIVNASRNIPVLSMNAHGMAWGALTSVLFATMFGHEFIFPIERGYIVSLTYLAIVGSAVVFGCYLALLRQIGSARAAYTSVLFPIVALLISTVVENYQWSVLAVAGLFFIVAGNWLALTRIDYSKK